MEIRIDGDQSSVENWERAQIAPLDQLPKLDEQQRSVAAKLGMSEEAYARTAYAGDLERKDLAMKAEKAGRLVEGAARQIAPGIRLAGVWWKTFQEKLRFDLAWNGSETQVVLTQNLIDDLLENGSSDAEARLQRVIRNNLPADWIRAS